jgi:hypothetical protein
MIALMIKAQITPETSASFYRTARHNIPENKHLQNDQLFIVL